MSPRKNGFTLLEICLALMIGLLLITLAVPSIIGVLAEQRLKHSFEVFDVFVQSAKLKSLHERRDYVMAWDEKGITLKPAGEAQGAAEKNIEEDAMAEQFTFGKAQIYTLERPAALSAHPANEWIFWKSGICEPAQIMFQGDGGKWTVRYDPLTARGLFLDSETK